MKAEFINPFLKASINLFKDYLGLQAVSGKPYLRADPQELDEVSALTLALMKSLKDKA